MRKSGGILLGSTVALALMSAPVLAKSQKADDKSAAATCTAYEKAADGSWTPVPCQEIGSGGRKHQESKHPSDDDANR
ncbi:MAG: hypothetical protein Q7T45_12415 [Bradyrhizobium sp.]|mgnify:CR=1 FL=1|uniref:hypothetical protein n=1 Tax=Bradyrhizobium sp. TaxID=376 RepID=UPI0027175396|nr:hypothetical protein [Bradyrhizobium sp.]MDO8398613.1 hypothetical protein [Bradyrhizobium sp.]